MSRQENCAVEVRHLSKSFDGIEVLRDISLEVKKGETISILGPSGSGKSTLLRCINWLEEPDRGKVFIAGDRIGRIEGNRPQPKKSLLGFDQKQRWYFKVLTYGHT